MPICVSRQAHLTERLAVVALGWLLHNMPPHAALHHPAALVVLINNQHAASVDGGACHCQDVRMAQARDAFT